MATLTNELNRSESPLIIQSNGRAMQNQGMIGCKNELHLNLLRGSVLKSRAKIKHLSNYTTNSKKTTGNSIMTQNNKMTPTKYNTQSAIRSERIKRRQQTRNKRIKQNGHGSTAKIKGELNGIEQESGETPSKEKCQKQVEFSENNTEKKQKREITKQTRQKEENEEKNSDFEETVVKKDKGRNTKISAGKKLSGKTKKRKNSFVRWSLEEEISLRDCVLIQSKESKTISWKRVMEMMPKRYNYRTPKKLRNKWRKLLFKREFVSEEDLKRIYKSKKESKEKTQDEGVFLAEEKFANEKSPPKKEVSVEKKIKRETKVDQMKNFVFKENITLKWLQTLQTKIERMDAKKSAKEAIANSFQNTENSQSVQKIEKTKKTQKTQKIQKIQKTPEIPNHPTNIPKIENAQNIGTKADRPKHFFPPIPNSLQMLSKNLPPKANANFLHPNSQTSRTFFGGNVLARPAQPNFRLGAEKSFSSNYTMPNYCRLFSPFKFGCLASKRAPRLETGQYRGYEKMTLVQLESLFYTYMRNLRYKRYRLKDNELRVGRARQINKNILEQHNKQKKEIERQSEILGGKEKSHEKILWRLQSAQMEYRFCRKRNSQKDIFK